MKPLFLLSTTLLFLTYTIALHAGESHYTKIDFANTCVWEKPASEEDAQMGGRAQCNGLKFNNQHWPIHFAEGDLRQFVGFGHISNLDEFVGGFSQWNAVNTTVEWRINEDQPYATILRWFIDNIDPDTGSAEKKLRGSVLVISKVAIHLSNGGDGKSCPIGYVDARANKNANHLAQEIADKYGKTFQCGFDQAKFYGVRGKNSGSPNDLIESQRRY